MTLSRVDTMPTFPMPKPSKRREERKAEQPCIVCGRHVSEPRYVVLVQGGARLARIEDDQHWQEVDPAGYMGWHRIGPECARLVPVAFVSEGGQ